MSSWFYHRFPEARSYPGFTCGGTQGGHKEPFHDGHSLCLCSFDTPGKCPSGILLPQLRVPPNLSQSAQLPGPLGNCPNMAPISPLLGPLPLSLMCALTQLCLQCHPLPHQCLHSTPEPLDSSSYVIHLTAVSLGCEQVA